MQFEVTVKTGDVRYAGTDANVYIIFVGTNGKSAKLFLDDSRNNFERGMTETFKVCDFFALLLFLHSCPINLHFQKYLTFSQQHLSL